MECMTTPRSRWLDSEPCWLGKLEALGYRKLCERNDQLCAILRFNFTNRGRVGSGRVAAPLLF
jgi:hypothetical protein